MDHDPQTAARSLYLVRHAIAYERGEDWPDDSKRPLTRKGIDRMRQGVRGLKRIGVTLDVVMTSPLVRAVQTAELVVRGLSPHPDLVTTPELAPEGSSAAVAKAVAKVRTGKHVALVGHEPDLGALAQWLIGSAGPVPFKKGGVCRIDIPKSAPAEGQGTLIWAATPKLLRALRQSSRV